MFQQFLAYKHHRLHDSMSGQAKVWYWSLTKLKLKTLVEQEQHRVVKKTSTSYVKLITKQEIILFIYHTTKCPTKAKKLELIIDFRGQNKPNTTEFHLLYYNS